MNDSAAMHALARRALEHFQNRTTDQADDVMAIPLAAYLDEGRYQAEVERIFKHLPLALALSLEVPDPGCYRAMDVLGVPVLIVRGTDERVRAFLNVCRHRGSPVCAEGLGEARVFACPYHSWTYDDAGRLIGIYSEDTFGDVDKSALGLRELFCAERAGLVWVGLTAGEDHDIDSWLGEFQAELGTLELQGWHLFEQRDLVGTGWKVALDGYLEAYHHNTVHGKTVGQHTVGNLLVLVDRSARYALTFGRKSLGELADQPESQWQPEAHIRLIHNGFPNLSISGVLNDHCLVSQIFPGPTPDTTITRQSILAANEPTTADEVAATENFSAMILQAVRDEDYAIGLGIQRALASGANSEILFGRNEPAVQNYHRWVAHFMKDKMDQ